MSQDALTRDLNYLYWSAYHAGHHDTVEGNYTDVLPVDRFDYWQDRVQECIESGDMALRSLAPPSAIAPSDSVCVPREPTSNMISSYLIAQRDSALVADRGFGMSDPRKNFRAGYNAMLAAAPPSAITSSDSALGQTVDQRDAAEEAVSEIYFRLLGRSPEWSNLFGFPQAIEEIVDAFDALRAQVKLTANLAPTVPAQEPVCRVCNQPEFPFCARGDCPLPDGRTTSEALLGKSSARMEVGASEPGYNDTAFVPRQPMDPAEALEMLKSRARKVMDTRPCIFKIGRTTCGYSEDRCMHEGSTEPEPPNGRHKYEPLEEPEKAMNQHDKNSGRG